MTRVLVLQGPNLNLLGTREPEVYGFETLDEIHAGIRRRGRELGLTLDFFQSNHEGALIDRLHRRDFDVAIVNAGAYTHTSIALRDALSAIQRPFVEVHLSDPARRESFRHVNYLRDLALESIVGQGARGYHLALEAIARRFGGAAAELRRLRRRIDALDRRIVELLNERARLALEVGERKAEVGQPVRDPAREREVLLRVTMGNVGPLPQADLLALYRRLIASTRRLESSARRSGRMADDDGGPAHPTR